MTSVLLRRLSLPLLSLCLCIAFVTEAQAQEQSAEIRLRDGTVMKARPSMNFDSGYVELGGGKRAERSKVLLICYSDCEDAPSGSSEQDLVVLRDGRHKSGELSYIDDRAGKAELKLSYEEWIDEELPLSEIAYIKFSDRVFYDLRQAVRAST